MPKPVILVKSVGETERLGFDYAARLKGETIATGTLTAEPAGLTITGDDITGSIVSHLVAGGSAGDYTLTCTITTSGGRTLKESATLRVTA